jgi:hypothetical protein
LKKRDGLRTKKKQRIGLKPDRVPDLVFFDNS